MGDLAVTEPADHPAVRRPERGVIDRYVGVERREVSDTEALTVVPYRSVAAARELLDQRDRLVSPLDGPLESQSVEVLDRLRSARPDAEG